MRRTMLALVAGMLVAAAVTPAFADWRSDQGLTRSSDARAARARVEQRLNQLQAPRTLEVEYSTPYLPYVEGDRGVDAQIRRLGELIRRQESGR
jgi:hypothetical protein